MSGAPDDSAQPWRTIFHAIVPHAEDPRLLMLETPEGWALPYIGVDERKWISEVEPIRPALRERYGIDATPLRCVYYHVDDERRRSDIIHETENLRPDLTPAAGRWVGRAELAGLALADPNQREAIFGWLDEAEGGPIPSERPPWARPGWFAPALAWIEAQLARAGIALLGPLELVRSWGLSCIIRGRTDSGDVYFKAVPPLFGQEAALTDDMAARFPANLPALIAVDRARSWMLMRDFGPSLRDRRAGIADWELALRRFGEIQVASIGRVEDLLALGCKDRRLPVLAEQIDELLADDAALAYLSAEEIARLRALAPEFRARCAQLAGYAIPHTLAHGDLHPGNIAVAGGAPIYFDWTDACVAHPFLDATLTLSEADALDAPDAPARLRDAYLSAWAGYEPPDRLIEAFELGALLGALHQAVSYRWIWSALEPSSKHEMNDGVADWLRLALRWLEKGV